MSVISVGQEVVVEGLTGPKLKVHHIDVETNQAECIWFDKNLVLQKQHININLLAVANDQPTEIQGEFPD